MRFHRKDVTLQQWFKQFKNTEALWIREATRFEMPQFETTILEYETSFSEYRSRSLPNESSDAEEEDIESCVV
jgi:hypothetical protein